MAATTEIGLLAPEQGAAGRATTARRDRRVVAGYALAAALVLVPVVRMIRIVLDGSVLQYADYWMMLPTFTGPDGDLHVAGLFEFQNHPVVVPKLVYWVNIHLFSGSNVALGLVVVGIALGQLVVVALLLRTSALRPAERMAIFVLAGALLFDLAGTWNFAKAMSGTAWLSANLFALVAIYLRSRDRPVAAGGLAALAAVSYGTGVVAWVAVIATGAGRRGLRDAWREWPYAVGLVLTFVWYRVGAGHSETTLPSPSEFIDVVTDLFASVLGLEGTLATVVGLVPLVGIPLLVAGFVVTSRAADKAGWVGVATFGWLASVEITSGRGVLLPLLGLQGRYSSLPALSWLGLSALVCCASRTAVRRLVDRGRIRGAAAIAGTWTGVVVAVVLAAGAVAAGREQPDAIAAERQDQELREVALRLGLADGTQYLTGLFGEPTTVTAIVEGTGHHPFVDGWDLDCGLLDDELDLAGVPAGDPVGEVLGAERLSFILRGAPQISGRVTTDRPIRCVVVTDRGNRVIGAASLADAGSSGSVAFTAIARNGAAEYRVYAVFEGDSRPHRLDGRVTAGDGGQLATDGTGTS